MPGASESGALRGCLVLRHNRRLTLPQEETSEPVVHTDLDSLNPFLVVDEVEHVPEATVAIVEGEVRVRYCLRAELVVVPFHERGPVRGESPFPPGAYCPAGPGELSGPAREEAFGVRQIPSVMSPGNTALDVD